MAQAMMAMAVANTVMNYQAANQQGDAAVAIGKRKQQEANFQADQLDVNAGQARAEGQVAALNEQRNTALTLSRARAVAAASGGGASDPTVINLMSRIAGEGAYRENVARFNGESQAYAMNNQANAARYGGQVAMSDARYAKQAAQAKAVSSLISGAASIYSMGAKYGWGGAGSMGSGISIDAGATDLPNIGAGMA